MDYTARYDMSISRYQLLIFQHRPFNQVLQMFTNLYISPHSIKKNGHDVFWFNSNASFHNLFYILFKYVSVERSKDLFVSMSDGLLG